MSAIRRSSSPLRAALGYTTALAVLHLAAVLVSKFLVADTVRAGNVFPLGLRDLSAAMDGLMPALGVLAAVVAGGSLCLYTLLARRRIRTVAGLGMALYLIALAWLYVETVTYASKRVDLTLALVIYTLEYWGEISSEFPGAIARITPLLSFTFLALAIGGVAISIHFARRYRRRELASSDRDRRTTWGVLAVALLGGIGAMQPDAVPRGPSSDGSAATDIPSPGIVQPSRHPYENSFFERYGFNLEPNTNLVILLLESTRADFVDLERTRFFARDPQVLQVEHFFVPVPHSSNSQYALLTGNHSSNASRWKYGRLSATLGLPGILNARGYESLCIFGGDASYDHAHRLFARLDLPVIDMRDLLQRENPRTGKPYPRFDWGIDDQALHDEALRFLDRTSGPFFLLVVFSNAHVPYFVADPDTYNEFNNDSKLGRYRNSIRYALDLSDGIVEAVTAREMEDNTLFVILSDHGESFGEHGFWDHDFSLYNPEVRVPFAMRHPALARLDVRPDSTIGTINDVYPTILDVLGVEFPRPVHGRSLFGHDYQLHLPLRSWGSQDYRGLLLADRKWIYSRKDNELIRVDLDDGDRQVMELGPRARRFVDALYTWKHEG